MFGVNPDNSKLINDFAELKLKLGNILNETEGATLPQKMAILEGKNRAIPDIYVSFERYLASLPEPIKIMVANAMEDSDEILRVNIAAPEFLSRFRVLVKTMEMI